MLSRRRFLMALMLAEEAHRLIGPTSFAHFAMRLFNVCWVEATWVWRAAGNLVGIVFIAVCLKLFPDFRNRRYG
jgi:hypothetical protein